MVESEEDPEAVRKQLLEVLSAYRNGELDPTQANEVKHSHQTKTSELPEDIKSELLMLLAKHRSSRVKRAA